MKPHLIDQDEGRRLLDQAARSHFQMSGDDFLAAWDRGDFADEPDPMKLLAVTTLIPYVRPSEAETPQACFARFAGRPDVGPILEAWSK
jgi:hypothetical protein